MNTDPSAAGHASAAPGPGDKHDPTANVLALVTAAIERIDALRDSESKRVDQNAGAEMRRMDDFRLLILGFIKERHDTQATHSAESRRSLTDQIFAAVEHTRVTENLRAEYQEKLAIAEAKRIDAIRSVDVNAVAVASERATQSAQVLANQVAQSADALRTLVATTATTFAQQQQSLQTQITERLALLERSQYESKGKAGVEDPRLQDLLAEVKVLSATTARGNGKQDGIGASWSVLVAVVAAVVAIASLVLANIKPNDPQTIYVQPDASSTAPIVIQPKPK